MSLFIVRVGVAVRYSGINAVSSIIVDRASSDEADVCLRSIIGKSEVVLCTKFKNIFFSSF